MAWSVSLFFLIIQLTASAPSVSNFASYKGVFTEIVRCGAVFAVTAGDDEGVGLGAVEGAVCGVALGCGLACAAGFAFGAGGLTGTR